MNKEVFLSCIIASRILHLYYHYCHLLLTGPTFVADHGLFKKFYKQLALDYDSLSEQFIQNIDKQEFDTVIINQLLSEELSKFKIEQLSLEEMFDYGLSFEEEFYSNLTKLDKQAPIGLRNLLGAIAEQSDTRKYKIRQRLEK